MSEPGASDSEKQWRAAVERALAGAPESSLTTKTLEGIPIAPLYGERDRPAAEGIPWLPRTPRLVGPALVHFHAPLLDSPDVGEGATAAWLVGAWPKDGEPDLPMPVTSQATLILADPSARRIASRGSERVRPIADPWSWWVSMRQREIEAGAIERIHESIDASRPSLGAAGWLWHDQGVSAVDEIGATTASLIESLRQLDDRGASLDAAIEGATVGTACGTDFFVEIAKLRAMRRVLDRALAACGIKTRPWLAAVSSSRIYAGVDVPTNLIRNSLATSAALLGGADVVCTHRHELGDEAQGSSAHIARNVPLVLTLESHLDAPSDPARGSYYVEHLTDAFARAGWEFFRSIESAGGIVRGRELVHERMNASRERRATEVRTRKRALVGVSRFPAGGTGGYSVGRKDSDPFEKLRTQARGRTARVVIVGACPQPRVEFARELLAVSGLPDEAARLDGDPAVVLGGASIVILCAGDADFGTSLVEAARALRNAGAKAIAVAGKPGAHEQALRDAGVDAFVFVGVDVVTAIETLLERAGATS